MTTAQDKIAQYLQEAHAMELALARTLQAHSAMTPTGEYRTALERHRRETQAHADRVARRLRDLGRSPGLAERGYGFAQRLAGQAVSLAMAPLALVRGSGGEEKLLKNAKDECAGEALEIATYEALEALARQVGDADTAALAADLRKDEEQMLKTLRELLPTLTAAVTVRAATGTTRTKEREEHRSPLSNYDELTVEDVTRRLDRLTPAQLRHVATYERAHKGRRGILDAVERHEQERDLVAH